MGSPLFIDMTDRPVDGYTILERVANSGDNEARWRCRHRCGAEIVMLGTVLRKRPPPQHCPNCVPTDVKRKRYRAPHVCGCTPQHPCKAARALFRAGQDSQLAGHLRRTLREGE